MPEKPPPPKASDVEDPSRLVHFGGPIDRACVALRLFGDSLDHDEITRLLGCQPTEARCYVDVLPDKRYHRNASSGVWHLKGTLPEKAEIEEQVLALLSTVTCDLQIWQRLTVELDVDIFCGVFLDTCNRGFCLSPHVTRMLSERGI